MTAAAVLVLFTAAVVRPLESRLHVAVALAGLNATIAPPGSRRPRP